MQRPNILYLHSHDTGKQLEPYGAPVRTPNFMKLAQSGTLFRHAFSAASSCSAARASFHTSLHPHQNGMTGLAHRGWYLNDYSKTIVWVLKENGYHTGLFGEHHIAPNAETDLVGYDEADLVGSNRAEIIAAAAVDWISNAPTDKPWFLSCGFWNTHRTSFPEVLEDAGKYGSVLPIFPDTPDLRRDYAALRESVEKLDWGIGEVLAALHASGQAENTIIIAATDHAQGFPEYKANVTDKGLGVYMMMAGPGIQSGIVYEHPVTHMDVFPTVCDLIGLDQPAWAEGKSLSQIVSGAKEDPLHDAIFGEANFHAAYEPQRSVRTSKFRYVRRYDTRGDKLVLPNIDDGPSKKAWVPVIERKPRALFDITSDPLERINLIDDPTYAKDVEVLEETLRQWQIRTKDPLLHGALAAPSGVQINDVDQDSAYEQTIAVD